MAGTKLSNKPQVVIEQEYLDSDSDDSNSGEELGDDLVEVKQEIEDDVDVDANTSNNSVLDDTTEIKSEEESEEEIEEEVDSDPEVSADEMSEDSDVNIDDLSEDEKEENRIKLKETKKEKKISLMAAKDVSSDTESDPDTDDEDADDEFDDKGESDDEESKAGLANVMASILSVPGGSNLILKKAKKDTDPKLKEETVEFEYVDAEGNVKKDVKIEVKEEVDQQTMMKIKEKEKLKLIEQFKLWPAIHTDKTKEKKLKRIATRGVVQLFSAIEKHKSGVRKEKLGTKSIVKREQIPASRLKASFMDILDKEGERVKKSQKPNSIKRKSEDMKDSKETIALPTSVSKKPTWNVFADNFYKEATLQGWNLKSDEED